jgi:hypothetical protein
MLPVKSALLFELIKQLHAARIDIPMPKRPTELLGIAPAEGPVPDAVDEGRGPRGSNTK